MGLGLAVGRLTPASPSAETARCGSRPSERPGGGQASAGSWKDRLYGVTCHPPRGTLLLVAGFPSAGVTWVPRHLLPVRTSPLEGERPGLDVLGGSTFSAWPGPAPELPSEPPEQELWFLTVSAAGCGQKAAFPMSPWTRPGEVAATLLSCKKYVSYLQMKCYVPGIGFKGTLGVDGLSRRAGSTRAALTVGRGTDDGHTDAKAFQMSPN